MGEQGKGQTALRSPQVVDREFARHATAGRIVPFASVKLCPACMAPRAAALMRYQDEGKQDPYLRVTCGVCQFSWSEAPAWTL